MTRAQAARLHALLADLGIVGRPGKLHALSVITSRGITSSNELVGDEIGHVIDALAAIQAAPAEERPAEIAALLGEREQMREAS